ncbi:hypothetical protein GOODEAATRI_011106, partial [Goodea atripinnis]
MNWRRGGLDVSGLEWSDRHHGTKRKTDSSGGVPHQTQGPAHTSEGNMTSKDSKALLKSSMSTPSLKRKRHKSNKPNRESSAIPGPAGFAPGNTAPPGVNTVKPLVEYDDISSESDTFSDPPSSRPSERGGGDRLDPSSSPEQDGDDISREPERENKSQRLSRKKPKDPNKVRDSGNGEHGYKKKSSKDREKGNTGKVKEKTASSGSSTKRQLQPEGNTKRGESALSVQTAASVGSTTSSTSSSRSKESSRSGKSHKERQQRREGRGDGNRGSSHRSRTDRTHRKSAKSHKSSPKGKSSSRGSPRRKGASSALSSSPRRGSESPLGSNYGQQGDDGYSRRRLAQKSPSPYGDLSRRSRQRSDSPYGSRHRSSSFERDSSPYLRRRSISPYVNRRSSSTSPVSRPFQKPFSTALLFSSLLFSFTQQEAHFFSFRRWRLPQ